MLTNDGTDTPVLFPIEVTYPYPNYMPQPCRPCLAVLFITRQDALMNIWLLTVEEANGGEGLADILAYYVDRTPSCKQAIRTCSVRRSRDGHILPSCPVGAAAEIAEMRKKKKNGKIQTTVQCGQREMNWKITTRCVFEEMM